MGLLLDEIRQTRDAERYGFAVGKVRVLATRILDGSAYERLLDARDFAECKRLLSDTVYGRHIEHAETTGDVERGLGEALEGFYAFLGEAQLPEVVERFFRIRYDYDNLRAVLKARAMGADLAGLLVEHGTVSPADLQEDLTLLSEPFSVLVADVLALAEDESSDATAIDALVDEAYFAERIRLARKSRSARLLDIARTAVDLANVKSLVRGVLAGRTPEVLSELLLEGGFIPVAELRGRVELPVDEIAESLARVPLLRTISPTELVAPESMDTAIGAVFSAAVHHGWNQPTGPDPVIAYVGAREGEVRILRILLLGTLLGTDSAVMREHVRRATGRW